VNIFGKALVAGDHKYSNANFATKFRAFGVFLENYNAAGLLTSPRAYLVPIGNDYLRTSSSPQPTIRAWGVKEQRIPVPFEINQGRSARPDTSRSSTAWTAASATCAGMETSACIMTMAIPSWR
jgi:hypothetical protein